MSCYDAWKTRSPDDERYYRMPYRDETGRPSEFYCSRCDDMGCDECCPSVPLELEDLDEIAEQIALAEKLTDSR